ncbi:MAG: FGGY family carbohydrate kinase [Planctomycetota bacterium]
MAVRGFLGIDAGTQGLSVVLTDESLNVVATGDGGYEMCKGLEEGCYEQDPNDWVSALTAAMADLKNKLAGQGDSELDIMGVGISGQMHGEVLVGEDQSPLKSARLWCDARNDAEGHELTSALNVKMPKRITLARWLWTLRNQPDVAKKVWRMTTPGGWLAFCLTGQFNLGVGDAAGMFPIDQSTMDYDDVLLEKFDSIAAAHQPPASLRDLLPSVKVAGEDGGTLNESGSRILGLPVGIPVAPAEGDQPASMAGSLIGNAGMVSVSFGTSVCANSIGDKRFAGVSDAVDHFCAPDGKPINMVWLRNGTTYMNTTVEMFGKMNESDNPFESVMPQVVAAEPDCGGMLALPFMDDEPGLGVSEGGTAGLFNINAQNATPGNAVKAAMLATMFNLRIGSEVLDRQGFPRDELVLSGGLTRTPELGQVLADVMNTRVTLFAGADEGCAWGAALMAKYRVSNGGQTWEAFLQTLANAMTEDATRFDPDQDAVKTYNDVYLRYQELLKR